jgi:hypothetical protein
MFMWAAVVEVEMPRNFGKGSAERLADAARYAGVLAVWVGLALIRPRLAIRILRERRSDSPLNRQGAAWPSGLTSSSERAVRSLRKPRVR